MPTAWTVPNASCAKATPSAVPTTGFTRPMIETAPADISRSPRNQHT